MRDDIGLVYQHVIQKIVEQINAGELPEGKKLPSERNLAERLNVSRNSLREALRTLEQRKIIVVGPNGSRFVAGLEAAGEQDTLYTQLEKAAVSSLLEARETLDEKIAELACLRATDAELEKIAQAFFKIKSQSGVQADPYLSHDNLFHLAIAEAAHNDFFAGIYSANLELLRKIRHETWRDKNRRKTMLKEHEDIYMAIKERDPLLARLAARWHVLNIKKQII